MKRSFALVAGIIACVAGCSSPTTTTTAQLQELASARITGTVSSTTGQPLDSAWVSVDAPGNYAGGFGFTNSKGAFAINLNRMLDGDPVTTNPDTVRFEIVTEWIKGKRADGTYPTSRTRHLLTFAPASPAPTIVSLQIAVP